MNDDDEKLSTGFDDFFRNASKRFHEDVRAERNRIPYGMPDQHGWYRPGESPEEVAQAKLAQEKAMAELRAKEGDGESSEHLDPVIYRKKARNLHPSFTVNRAILLCTQVIPEFKDALNVDVECDEGMQTKLGQFLSFLIPWEADDIRRRVSHLRLVGSHQNDFDAVKEFALAVKGRAKK